MRIPMLTWWTELTRDGRWPTGARLDESMAGEFRGSWPALAAAGGRGGLHRPGEVLGRRRGHLADRQQAAPAFPEGLRVDRAGARRRLAGGAGGGRLDVDR